MDVSPHQVNPEDSIRLLCHLLSRAEAAAAAADT